MQISSMIKPTEIQPTNFKLPGTPAIEKADTRQTEIPEPPPENNPGQTETLRELQNALAEQNVTLDFSRDDATKELVVRLVDGKTGEALHQFPSEVSLKLTAVFAKLQGQFVDEKY